MTTTTLPTDLLVSATCEAETRRVMAARVALKRVPGTHGERAAMVAEVDYLIDRWLELDHGQGAAPHA